LLLSPRWDSSTSVGPDRGISSAAPDSFAPVDAPATATTTTTTTAPTAPSGVPKPIANGTPPVEGGSGSGPWGANRNHASIVSATGVPGPIITVAAIEAGKPQAWGEGGASTSNATATTGGGGSGTTNWAKGKGISATTQPSGPTPTPASTVSTGSSWLKIVQQRPQPPPPPVAPTTTTAPSQQQQQSSKAPSSKASTVPSQAPVEDMASLAPVPEGDQVAGTGLSASDKTVGPPSKAAPGPSAVQR